MPHQLLQRGRGERAVREREDRPPREAPAVHHRQGRGDPGGDRHRLQRRGRPQAILRQRGGLVVIPKRAKLEEVLAEGSRAPLSIR